MTTRYHQEDEMQRTTVGKSGRYVREDGTHRRYGRRWTAVRTLVLQRDGHVCVYCGQGASAGNAMEVDHVVPFSAGVYGEYDERNLAASCFTCNRGWQNRRKPQWQETALLAEIARRIS